MQDLLVPLYKLPSPPIASDNLLVRTIFPAEIKQVSEWVRQKFGEGWASELEYAANQSPVCSYVALQDRVIIGFACFNAAARGVFGPTGITESARGEGVGTQLLFRALQDMRAQGYAYAIIGAAGPIDYYRKTVGAITFNDGAPGFLKSLMPQQKEST
jgi:predicted N-acetyltransferase YhbS